MNKNSENEGNWSFTSFASDKFKLNNKGFILIGVVLVVISFFALGVRAADPDGASITTIVNETSTASGAAVINVSGGYISTINLTARVQNPRWKGMVGWLNGKFALSDATGSTLFDWSTVITGGKVYATHNISTVTWSQIKCSDTAALERENLKLNQSRFDDNVTATFSDNSHRPFNVGSVSITESACPTLNTYVNNATQQGEFEEVALFDGVNTGVNGNIIYTALLNQTKVGFDGNSYDFQMIVPERGLATWTSSTAYYLYVELS